MITRQIVVTSSRGELCISTENRKVNVCGGGVYRRLFNWYARWLNCIIPSSVRIGKGLRLPHPLGIVISAYAEIGDFCTIYHNVTIGANEHKNNYKNAPHIGNNVYIGANACLIGDINIGDNCIIGANATVTRDAPAGSIIVGENRIIEGAIERNPHPHFEK